jgi:hypothetical protein
MVWMIVVPIIFKDFHHLYLSAATFFRTLIIGASDAKIEKKMYGLFTARGLP